MTWGNTPLNCFTEEEIKKYYLTNIEEIPEYLFEKINTDIDIENESQIFKKNMSGHDNENNDNEIKERINESKVNYNIMDINKDLKEGIKVIKEENEEENELNEVSNKEEDISKIKSIEGEDIFNEGMKKKTKKIYFFKEEDYQKRIPMFVLSKIWVC